MMFKRLGFRRREMALITGDPGAAGIMAVAPVLLKLVWQQRGVFTQITGVNLCPMLALIMLGEIGIPVGLERALVTHVLEALAPLLELVVLVRMVALTVLDDVGQLHRGKIAELADLLAGTVAHLDVVLQLDLRVGPVVTFVAQYLVREMLLVLMCGEISFDVRGIITLVT